MRWRSSIVALFFFAGPGWLLTTQDTRGQVSWVGDVSSDAGVAENWDPDGVPIATSNVVLRAGTNPNVDLSDSPTWNRLDFNNVGPTNVNGFGTITLNADNGGTTGIGIFSGGGPHDAPSVIAPHVITPGDIQANGSHSLTFNGSVSARAIESFDHATATFNGPVTLTGMNGDPNPNDDIPNAAFLTGGNSGSVVFNSTVHWSSNFPTIPGVGQEYGIRGDIDVTFAGDMTSDHDPAGFFIINMFDGATVRNGAHDVIGTQTDLWSRRGNNLYDLGGFNDNVEFIGTSGDVTFGVDFGPSDIANTLVWQASHNMNGDYAVTGFEIGSDSMQLGPAGDQFFTDIQLAQITINGIAYSATDPGNGNAYWNRDAQKFVQFFNMPALPGDYNDDLTVNAADFVVWRKNLGMNVTLPNDVTPGEVDDFDYGIWRLNFGEGLGGGAAAGGLQTIPEPSTVGLGLLTSLVVCAVVRRRALCRRPGHSK